MTDPAFAELIASGLNRIAVLNVADLPETQRRALLPAASPPYRQLILIAHAGRTLWENVLASGMDSEHPIDDFTIAQVSQWLSKAAPGRQWARLYPGNAPIGLQALGTLAGWHHASPFMIGIDSEFGTWFAYRAALLADTDFTPGTVDRQPHPCLSCREEPCLTACPAAACQTSGFLLERCIDYRLAENSACATSCLARLACPLGAAHRYEPGQIEHSYSRSLQMIRQYRTPR